jgi:hypothetical protein
MPSRDELLDGALRLANSIAEKSMRNPPTMGAGDMAGAIRLLVEAIREPTGRGGLMDDTFMLPEPPRPRVSFMKRLQWRETRNGVWRSGILDTTKPEILVIARRSHQVETPDGQYRREYDENAPWTLSVSRAEDLRPSSPQVLGTFSTPDEAKEFARNMVGDPE